MPAVGCGVGYWVCWCSLWLLLLFSMMDNDDDDDVFEQELVALDFDGIGNLMEGNQFSLMG